MRQLAPLFGVSPATVCRVIQRLRPLLGLEPAARPADTADRLWIVDGTVIPVRDRTVGASSCNYRFSANVQVIIDADTRLVVAVGRPAPGNKADAHVWRNSGLPAQCQGVTVLGDGAYINTGLVVSHRKRPGRPLLPGEEADNAEHRKVRARVEHAFARMKNYKILRDCRQHGDGLRHAVQAVAQIAIWIAGFCNTRCLHSICGFKSPIDYEHVYRTGLTVGWSHSGSLRVPAGLTGSETGKCTRVHTSTAGTHSP